MTRASVSHVICVDVTVMGTHLVTALSLSVILLRSLVFWEAGKFSPVIVRMSPPAGFRSAYGEMSVMMI